MRLGEPLQGFRSPAAPWTASTALLAALGVAWLAMKMLRVCQPLAWPQPLVSQHKNKLA